MNRLSISDILLICINLIPLYGVWFEGWDPLQVFIIYCAETLIVGIVTIFKIVLASAFVKPEKTVALKKNNPFAGAFFVILFFMLHYGIFVFVQTQIFMSTAGIGEDAAGFLQRYAAAARLLGTEGYLMLLIFIAYYILDMINGFIVTGKYKTTALLAIMFQPYGRIFVQQVIVIIGSFFLMLRMPKIFIVIFVAVKIFADFFSNRYFNRKMNEAMNEKGSAAE